MFVSVNSGVRDYFKVSQRVDNLGSISSQVTTKFQISFHSVACSALKNELEDKFADAPQEKNFWGI